MSGRRISPLVAIFLTVFFDMTSFGIVIPDVQVRVAGLTPSGFIVGLTLATFSIAQFFCAPYLGRLSDRVGRRPVLLVTTFSAMVASLIYSQALTLPVIWLSRSVLGVAGANLSVAYAYVTDSTTPAERGKSMGLIGMAFGLGFMFGPPTGAILLKVGHGHPLLLGIASAAFALINFLFVLFALPESRKPETDIVHAVEENRFSVLWKALRTPGLGTLLSIFFVAQFAFTNLESTFYRLGKDVYHVDQMLTTYVLIAVGATAAIAQGGLSRILLPRLGEVNLIRAGYLLQSPIFLTVPLVPWGPLVFLGAIGLGLCSGVSQPSVQSLISKSAPPALVGGIFGVTQSLGSIARIVGPIFANGLFNRNPVYPYAAGAVLLLFPAATAWRLRQPADPSTQEPEAEPA